jgi:hypothetical protein
VAEFGGRALVYRPADDQLFVIHSARRVRGLRGKDGTCGWELSTAGGSECYSPGAAQALLDPSGDLLVTAVACDFSGDCFTRRLHVDPIALPEFDARRVLVARDGEAVRLWEDIGCQMNERLQWLREGYPIPGATNAALDFSMSSTLGGVHALEIQRGSQRLILPGWRVIYQFNPQLVKFAYEGRHGVYLYQPLPSLTAFNVQISTNLVDWTTTSSGLVGWSYLSYREDFPTNKANWPPTRFIRVLIP